VGRPRKLAKDKKQRPKGKSAGRALSPVKKEQIRQTFLLTLNKTETARNCGVGLRSVYNVLNEAEDPEVVKNRARAAVVLSGKVHVEAERILNSVAQESLEGHYLVDEEGDMKFDRQGRPIWVGPTMNQKIIGAAILIDKLPVIEKYRSDMDGERTGIAMPTPDSIEALLSGIQMKVKRLKVLDVEFEDSDTSKRADDLLKDAQREIEAEFTEVNMGDFDNPSEG